MTQKLPNHSQSSCHCIDRALLNKIRNISNVSWILSICWVHEISYSASSSLLINPQFMILVTIFLSLSSDKCSINSRNKKQIAWSSPWYEVHHNLNKQPYRRKVQCIQQDFVYVHCWFLLFLYLQFSTNIHKISNIFISK